VGNIVSRGLGPQSSTRVGAVRLTIDEGQVIGRVIGWKEEEKALYYWGSWG
jgi:hypothetical protein